MPWKFFIPALLIVLCSFSIPSDGVVRVKFPEKDSKIKTDGFGNIYIIHNDKVSKYNALGVFQKAFSTKRYGKIDFLDATNPLKILVYFKDFQQLLFLDNQLTASSDMISLESIGYEQTSLVCSSANNSFWLFDKQNNELVRFNQESKILVKTGNLKRILDIDFNPNYLQEHNGYVYLNCPIEGIMVFDIYGTYVKTIPLKNLTEFNIINSNVYYFENKTLKEYQSQTFNTIAKQFTDSLLQTVYWQNNKFYKVYSDSLVVQ